MTKLEPITSEEVLARQVKEQIEASPHPISPNEDSNTPTVSSSNAPEHSDIKNTGTIQPEEKEVNVTRRSTESGFQYRLPIGSYILSFVYLQVFVVAVYGIFITIMMGLGQDHTMAQSLNSIHREMWGALVIPIVFSFFIFSGNNTLRLLTIAGSSLLLLILGYQFVTATMTFISSGSASSAFLSFFSTFLTTYVLVFLLGIVLLLSTIVYLLRKKVSDAYN